MSSLGVSLLLLLVVAVAVVVGYNLRQGAWPRWEQACRRMIAGMRARGKTTRADAVSRREGPSGNGRRGEPRLGDGVPARHAADLAGVDESDPDASARIPPEAAAPEFGAARDDGEATAPLYGEHAFEARAAAPDGEFAPPGSAAPAAGAAWERARPPGQPPRGAATSASAHAAPAGARAEAEHLPPVAGAPVSRGGEATEQHGASAAAAVGSPAASTRSTAVADSSDSNAAETGAHGDGEPLSTVPVPPTNATSGPALSEACDCIIELAPASPLSGERLLAIAQRFRRAGSKPVAFDARASMDDGGFAPPVAGRTYGIIRVGILMANRHGPLNAMEFSEFVSSVQAMAETLSARAEMPAMGSVLARARDLDSTCAQLDVQIGVNVEAPEAVEPAQLAAIAPTLSLVERGSHRYVRPGPQGEPLFSLGFSDSPSRLTFLLDVPRVAASLEPFARMVQAAGACAQRLGAKLVDDTGKPLTQASLAQIARQLEQRYESLEAIGLPAGSTLACKVFN